MKNALWVILGLGAVGGAVYYYTRKTPKQKRDYLISTTQSEPAASAALAKMSDDEIETAYTFITDYVNRGKQVPQGSTLYTKVMALSQKYGIFN